MPDLDYSHAYAANLWRWVCGLPERDLHETHSHTMAEALTNWDQRFIELMHNRMLLGIYRHGNYRDPGQPDYDRIGSALHRIALYVESGNGEHLVDAANLLMIDFSKRAHPRFHFQPADDAYHTEVRGGT